jgi:hypothetical protein
MHGCVKRIISSVEDSCNGLSLIVTACKVEWDFCVEDVGRK